MYLTAYETGGRAPAPARTRESIEQFPVDAKLAHTIVTGLQTETGRKALIAAVDIMIEREERIDPDTGEILDDAVSLDEGMEAQSGARINDPMTVASPANAGGDDVDSSAWRASNAVEVGATNSPETADEMDDDAVAAVKGQSRLANVDDVEPLSSNQTTPDPHILGADDGQRSIHSSSPASAKSDGHPTIVGQGRESGVNRTGSKKEQAVTNFEPPAFLHKPVNLRPDCQHPSACAGYGSNHCYACRKQIPEVA
jgi:hypothetical protein